MRKLLGKIVTLALALAVLLPCLSIRALAFDNSGWYWPVPDSLYMSRGYFDAHQAIDIISTRGVNETIVSARAGTVIAVYEGCSKWNGYNQEHVDCNPVIHLTTGDLWGKKWYNGKTYVCNHGIGNGIIIDHGNGVLTEYSHMASTNVSVGQHVEGGVAIGTMGAYGNATGRHLHFAIRTNSMLSSGGYPVKESIAVNSNPYGAEYIIRGDWNQVDNIWYSRDYSSGSCSCEYGEWQIETEPTCTENGSRIRYCLKCGRAETEVVPSTGHSWSKTSEQSATCEEAGYINYQCANCSETKTETSDPVGHDWQESGRTEASCQQVASITYTCSNCGKSYTQYADGDVSAWSETYPEGIREDLIETKTQYRYQDYMTTTSYETSLSGYDRVSSQWTKSGSSTYDYVAAWPAGFDTGNSFYAAYNKSPLTNSETQTDKIVVIGSSNGGYLLWHWCRGTYYNGPINRKMNDGWSSEFGTFHAFYSDNNGSNTNPEGNNGGGEDVRYYYNNGCCTDTYWYFATEVTRQSYDAYRNLFTYGKWDSWSDWSDTVYSASDTRNVETRTMYRYVTAPLGEHNWDKGVVTQEATCTADGVKTFTCSLCKEIKTEAISKLGHAYSDNVCTRCGDVLMTVKVGAAEACAGDSVKIPVVLSDNDGFVSFTLEILSDDALTLTNISKGSLLTPVRGTFSTTTDVGGGSVSWSGSSKITSDGVLMELTFAVPEDAAVGAYAVNLKSSGDQTSSFMDENSKSIPMAFISGNVIVFPETTFTLPGNVTRIEEEAFAGNTAIVAVELPSGLKSIGARAFQNCSNMTMIVMDAGVTDIAVDAFDGCSKDLLFCCPAGSYAQTYAETHGFRSIAP